LREFIEHSDAIFFEGSHDGYERLDDPVTHTRSALFIKPDARNNLPAYLIIRDQFAARKHHRYSIRYHLTPDCGAKAGASCVEARHTSGAALTIRVICETDIETKITAQVIEGWVSTCYARYTSAPVAVFEAEGEGPYEFLTLIFPGAPDQIAELEERIIKQWSGARLSTRRDLQNISKGEPIW
jgi:hypothetical protein